MNSRLPFNKYLDRKFVEDVSKYYDLQEIPEPSDIVLDLHQLMTGGVNDKAVYPAITPIYYKKPRVGTASLGWPPTELQRQVENLTRNNIRQYYVDTINKYFPEYVDNFFVSKVIGTSVFISWLGKEPSDFDIMVADNRNPVKYIKGESLVIPSTRFVREYFKNNGNVHEFRGEVFELDSSTSKHITMKPVNLKATSVILRHLLKSL